MSMNEIIAAIDIETYDPNLKNLGCGARRHEGHIICIGIHCPNLHLSKWFRPDEKQIHDIIADKNIVKVFHNGIYDTDWLDATGFVIDGRIEDTMTREYLLNAYRDHYDLDTVAKDYGIPGKQTDEISDWCKIHGLKGKAQTHLDVVPIELTGKYCVYDCIATYNVYIQQQPILEHEGLLNANDIECRLYPVLLKAKRNGIRFSKPRRDELADKLDHMYAAGFGALQAKYPWFDSVSAPTQLERIWKVEGIPIVRTETGRPSFNATVMEKCEHPVAKEIMRVKEINTILTRFVDGAIMDYAVGDHLYPTFYPALRDRTSTEGGGTVTGRMSCRNPNLQQMPAREDKFGDEIRSLFIPEDNCDIAAFDYKQIEYRVFLHYAVGPGAVEARQKFVDNPLTDYHQMTLDFMGWTDRHLAKNFNFGSIYGLGANSFAERFRGALLKAGYKDVYAAAHTLMDEYFEKLTYVRPTCNNIQKVAQYRGYVRTLSGRRQRVPLDGKMYKMVNYLVQGSASDILKKGLVDADSKGLWDYLKIHGFVHDENVFSIPRNKASYEAAQEFEICMSHAYETTVPILVDHEVGSDWGHCTSDFYKNRLQEVCI